MPVEWNEISMGTGVSSVDDQHMQLIDSLNDLVDTMRSGCREPKIAEMLDKLDSYARDHFSHEERCMEEYGCAIAARNKKEHRKFLALMETLRKDYDLKGPSRVLAMEIEAKLLAWLIFHIKGTDRQLYGYVTAIGELEIV